LTILTITLCLLLSVQADESPFGCSTKYYRDADGDGFGNANDHVLGCTAPEGYVENGDDCDDMNDQIGPMFIYYYRDADGDGFGNTGDMALACSAPEGYVAHPDDCDDTSAEIHPGATEVCNLIDDNCSGVIDEYPGMPTFYCADSDGDTYGNNWDVLVACSAPEGYVENCYDCDDMNDQIGQRVTYYKDADRDGFGNANDYVLDCSAPEGYVENGDDCDDMNDRLGPMVIYFKDADRDGFGNANE